MTMGGKGSNTSTMWREIDDPWSDDKKFREEMLRLEAALKSAEYDRIMQAQSMIEQIEREK